MPDYFISIHARNEHEARSLIIKELREKFSTMTDQEIENEFGLLVLKK